VDVPLTWGVLRPVILLPRDAEGWSDERLVLVLRHELAHVARHDVASQLTACVARALYWPNPLVWYAERALRRECEQACDDAVLAAGTRPTRYAEELLDIARTVTEGRVAALAPSFASAAPIERRVRALLDARVRRRPTTRMHAMTGAFASLGIVVPLAAMSPVPQARPSIAATLPAAAAAPVRDTSALSIRMPTREAARGRAPALATPSLRTLPIRREERAELCPSDGRSSHTNMTSERSGWKTWDVRWSGRDCSVELRAEGEITFNDDFTDVMRISRGGSFDLAVRQGDALTRLVMTPTGDGGLARRFTVNGAEREWNSEARAWLAGFLLQLDRQTGFAIEARFPKLLAQGGVRAVLEEIALLQGDYVRGLYFQKLIADAKLDPSQVRQVLDLAGGNVKSDYELARVLVAIADRYGLPDEPTRSAFLRAVNTISSDYERNRTLQTLLGRSDLSAGEAAAVLQSASALHSDYELARTLVAMASKRLVTPALRGAYLDDAAKLSSDYERSRTLLALLDTGKLDPADVTRVIALAGAMNSDYERARVLVNIAGSYELDAKTRDAYLKAADDIKSDYERGRTLSALRGRQR
jgi:hypothetical protein